MRVLVLNGSPKGDKSNTYRLTSAFLDGLRQTQPVEAETIEVGKLHLLPCRGCFACWSKTPGKCVLQDDMAGVIEKILAADVLIWSFPLYYFSIPGQLKLLIDRQLPMSLPFMTDTESGGHPSRYDRSGQRQIGLLIPKLDNNFYARIASVLMEDAYQEDYTVLMLSYEYSSEKEKRGLVNMVQNDTETIVIVNGEDDENSIRKLVASGVHVILADRRSTIPGTSYIAYDNHQVLLETIGFLKQKGYQSIGFLSEPPNISNLSDRFAAYQKGLSQYGYPFRPEHVFISDTFREDHFGNGCQYMEQLLRTHARHELPEAFIVSSDLLAVGVMKAIQEAGYRIPEDFAIVGFDNLQISACVQPPLTTVCQDRARLGHEIWEQAKAWHEGRTPQNVVLGQSLIIRDSC